jgi:phosphopentomutase
VKATGLDALFDATIKEMKEAGDETIVFTNFVDFDSSWGHRRDVAGYAAGLELFDRRLPELMELVGEDDILILTADHGCDPTWTGTDHTREHIPVLIYGPKVKPGSLGHRETFADIGQTGNVLRYVSDGIRQKHAVIICPVSLVRRAFFVGLIRHSRHQAKHSEGFNDGYSTH